MWISPGSILPRFFHFSLVSFYGLVTSAVDFLNDLMHMIKHGYLTKEHVLNIYYLSILACADRLLPWWLDGFRKEHGSRYYYENFQQLCTQIKTLGEGKLLDWDTKYKLG
jgi:hypothetical protein